MGEQCLSNLNLAIPDFAAPALSADVSHSRP